MADLEPQVTGAVKAVLRWAKPQFDTVDARYHKLVSAAEKLAVAGDWTPLIQSLCARVDALESEREPVHTDDETIESVKRQLSRHREHLARLQDRIAKLEAMK